MTYCVTPKCRQPNNPEIAKFCQSCGAKLLLKDRYLPIQVLGQGGFGRTFLAVDRDIPSLPPCAVKQLYYESGNSDILPKIVQLFHQEAIRLDDLGKHPQIPTLLAHFEENGQLYLVQEYIEGQTLDRELQQSSAFTVTQVWQLLEDLLPVLQFIHRRQVIHRDIKPSNIMRRSPLNSSQPDSPGQKSANPGQLVLIDFGIAKLFSANALLQTGTVIGTPAYMAPEQSRGKTLPASDLYSLAVTCIHLLTGVSPSNLFDANRNAWVWKKYLPNKFAVSGRDDRMPLDRLAKVLDKMLENAASDRYQSAAEVLQALKLQHPTERTTISMPQKTQPKLIHPKNRSPIRNRTHLSQSIPWSQQLLSFLPWRQPVSSSDLLTSEVAIDYIKLRDLLAAQKWQLADRETRAALCQTLGKPPRGYLFTEEIGRLPCIDLRTIDWLWVKYSQGRFGFSVQTRIYQALDEDYGSFCASVGWLTYNRTPVESGFKFKKSAPLGHLPSRIWSGGIHWWRHAEIMASRITQCEIV